MEEIHNNREGSIADDALANGGSEGKRVGDILGVNVTLENLLEAGAHFGHQTDRWNPKMLKYIYGVRNGVHIINLDLTIKLWEKARKYIVDRSSVGGSLLIVGTKMQGRDIVREEAERSGSFYVISRWLGGTLTNFDTIKNSIERMKKLEDLLVKASESGSEVKLSKKEKLSIKREVEKLNANLGGIRSMKKLPDVLFVVDIGKDDIAIKEAKRLHIPVVALVDTNTDPDLVDFPIPSNDDSPKTIRLFASAVSDAVLEGKRIFEERIKRFEEGKPSDLGAETKRARGSKKITAETASVSSP